MNSQTEKVQFTPGPWKASSRFGHPKEAIFIESGDGVTGYKTIAKLPPYGTDESEANARLIAAAPDLLANLEAAYQLIANNMHATSEEIAVIAECIRKAKGQ